MICTFRTGEDFAPAVSPFSPVISDFFWIVSWLVYSLFAGTEMPYQVVHLIVNEPVLVEQQQLQQPPGVKLDPYYSLIDWKCPAACEKVFVNVAADAGFGVGVNVCCCC